MKLVQLLSGAAAAALIAGAASAQTVTNAGSGDYIGDAIIASEFTATLDGDVDISVNLSDAFAALGAGGEVDMIITVTGATFDGIVTDDLLFVDVSCNFDIVSGGGAGGNSVTFRSTEADLFTCTGGANATDVLTLPLAHDAGNTDIDINVDFVRNSGNSGYAGGDTDLNLISYDAATGFTFTSNGVASDMLVTGGTLIDWSAVATAGTPGLMGTFSADALSGNEDVDLAGTALNDYDIALADANEIVFTFTDVTNITGITATAGSCAAPDAGTNTVTCELDAAEVNTSTGAAVSYTLDISAAAAVVAPQTIAVAFSPDSDTNFTVGGESDASFSLLDEDDGVFTTDVNNAAGNPFVWTSLRTTGGTKSAFRITGLEANPSEIAVVLDSVYARTGATAPTGARAVITGADVQEDPLNAGTFTATFTSEDIAAALGTAGGINGDLHFEVVLADGTGVGSIAASRLLSTGGVVAGSGFDN